MIGSCFIIIGQEWGKVYRPALPSDTVAGTKRAVSDLISGGADFMSCFLEIRGNEESL